MKKITVRYEGVHPKGTIKPRRMWYPGDRVKLPIDVAQEVLKESGFVEVKVKRRKKKKKTNPGAES